MKNFYLLIFLLPVCFLPLNSQVVDSTFGEPFSFILPDSFFIPGITAVDFDERDDRSYSMLFLDNGNIIIAGHTSWDGESDFAFTRLLPDGKYDETAGINGKVQLDLGYQNDSCLAASLYQSDKLLMGGCVADSLQTGFVGLLVKTDLDGNTDNDFGNQGKVIIDLSGTREMITQILPLPDGKIIIAGNMYYGSSYQSPDSTVIFIGRLLPDGLIDSSFATNGFIFQRFNTCNSTLLNELKLDNNSNIVITGGGYHPYPGLYWGDFMCDPGIHICRYLPNGLPDPDFGTDGIAILSVTEGRGNALAFYEDGRIIVAGVTSDFLILPVYTIVARLLPDGSRDSTFGVNGYFRQFLNGLGDGSEPVAVILHEDELLIPYIDSPLGNNITFGVFCLTQEGHLNPAFGENGIFSYNGKLPWTQYSVNHVQASPDHQKIYFGGTYQKLYHDNMMICRLDVSNKFPTLSTELVAEPGEINIFPNPFKETATLFTNYYLSPDAYILLYNTAGNPVHHQKIHFGSNLLSLDHLQEGFYFYTVKDRDTLVKRGKLICAY